jgi:hypothetical protein
MNYLGTFVEDYSAGAENLNSINNINDVEITGTPSNGQVLKWSTGLGKWVNGSDSTTVADINDITNVTVTSPTNGQVLKYNSSTSTWVNSADSTTVADINDITNVNITSPTNGQVLKYNSSTSTWVNGTDNNNLALSGLSTDVVVNSPQNNNLLRYSSLLSKWENVSFEGQTVTYTVTIADNGSGTQEVFSFNGTEIKTFPGGVENPLTFEVGNRYRFDLSDPSNTSRLKFSTTVDTSVPASVTPYTTGVTEVGSVGTAGAYTDIIITDSTPRLYFYLDEVDPAIDTSNVGQSVLNQISYGQKRLGSEDLANSAAASLTRTASYFTTAGAETATLAAGSEGQIKVFAYYGEGAGSDTMVITVTNPGWGGSGTITFDAVGESCTLQYINGKWFCIGNNDATFA